ncbi:MAG TPA: amidohydrolase, partial [Chitinophagaceae bacterium]|nr:amidohydrolase [Chitinophagaceae bacterium]
MRNLLLLCMLLLQFILLYPQKKTGIVPENKKSVLASVERHQQELISLSDSVWKYAETALNETQSSKILADYAEKNGFTTQRGVAEMPTAFIASFGTGKPIIAILGEFDALPGLSQKTVPQRSVYKENAAGHGCGHNMFGAASLGAALAIKELIAAGKLKGTIRFYGTPAEEDIGGKIYMARAGLFNDVDVCLDWHPDFENKANMQSSQSMVSYIISFKGKSAHAAADPWNGRSALDGAEFFTHGINYLREHVRPSVRMHYVFKKAGDVPNVVPAEASVWLWIRDSKRSGVAAVEKRMREVAAGAATMAGVESAVSLTSGDYELLINETGARALQANMELVGPVSYTTEEIQFANTIMKEYGSEAKGINGAIKPLEVTRADPDGGSTDVGDVSYLVPEITLLATTAPFQA